MVHRCLKPQLFFFPNQFPTQQKKVERYQFSCDCCNFPNYVATFSAVLFPRPAKKTGSFSFWSFVSQKQTMCLEKKVFLTLFFFLNLRATRKKTKTLSFCFVCLSFLDDEQNISFLLHTSTKGAKSGSSVAVDGRLLNKNRNVGIQTRRGI